MKGPLWPHGRELPLMIQELPLVFVCMKVKVSRCLSQIGFGLVGKFWTMLKSGLLDVVKLSVTFRLTAQKLKGKHFNSFLNATIIKLLRKSNHEMLS